MGSKNKNLSDFYQELALDENTSPFKDTLSFIKGLNAIVSPPQTRKSIDTFAKKLKEIYSEKIIDCWEKEIEQCPKLETYCAIKECFQRAPYLGIGSQFHNVFSN